MNNTFKTLLITASLITAISFAPKAYADCQEIYGGSQNCSTSNTFSIQKLVQDPSKDNGNFIGNLSKNDAKYAPSNNVNFEIKVTNTSSQAIPTITITDVFPQYLTYVSGNGDYDTTNKTLTFTVTNLAAGETKTFNIVGKLADSSNMPNQGIVCLVNKANGTDSNGATNSSSSQFCVEKQVLGSSYPVYTTKGGLVETPATGPEMLPLFGLIPGGLAGLFLRKKSIKK